MVHESISTYTYKPTQAKSQPKLAGGIPSYLTLQRGVMGALFSVPCRCYFMPLYLLLICIISFGYIYSKQQGMYQYCCACTKYEWIWVDLPQVKSQLTSPVLVLSLCFLVFQEHHWLIFHFPLKLAISLWFS